jgi:DNA-directed RNA polymerase subunit RPC12/RpoP
MSATHAHSDADTTTTDVPPDIDAYAIEIPDAFIEGYAGDTVAEKLINAEAAPPAEPTAEYQYGDLTARDPAATTTVAIATDADTGATCVRCGSRRLSPKSTGTQDTKLTEGYVCETCRTHVSDPENPETAEIVFSDGQTQLGRWADE